MDRSIGIPAAVLLAACNVAFSAPMADTHECLAYQPAIVSLSGMLERRVYPGRPNFESLEEGDEPETGFYLVLPKPVCFGGGAGADGASMVAGVTLVQLNLEPAQFEELRPHLGEVISVRGGVHESFSGHHHAPVVMILRKWWR